MNFIQRCTQSLITSRASVSRSHAILSLFLAISDELDYDHHIRSYALCAFELNFNEAFARRGQRLAMAYNALSYSELSYIELIYNAKAYNERSHKALSYNELSLQNESYNEKVTMRK